MPSIAQATDSPNGTLKRRREDADTGFDLQTKLTSPHLSRHIQNLEADPILIATPGDNSQYPDRRRIHAKPRRLHDSKRLRLSLDNTLDHDSVFARESLGFSLGNKSPLNLHNTLSRTEASRETRPKIDLNPCHICRRKPTLKSELDQYADCEGCRRRTCYICIRECLGSTLVTPMLEDSRCDFEGDYDIMLSFGGEESVCDADARTRNGKERLNSGYNADNNEDAAIVWQKGRMKEHKSMVCSGCCIEKGSEGEVLCLGCLRAEEER